MKLQVLAAVFSSPSVQFNVNRVLQPSDCCKHSRANTEGTSPDGLPACLPVTVLLDVVEQEKGLRQGTTELHSAALLAGKTH